MPFIYDYMPEGTLTQRKRTPTNLNCQLIEDSPWEPITVQQFRLAAKLPTGHQNRDASDIEQIISAVRKYVETYIKRTICCQTWKQTQDVVDPQYKLYRNRVLQVDSVSYIANWETEDVTTLSASSYILGGDRVASASGWPSHRGFQSWITVFKTGYALVTDPNDAQQVADARAAIPPSIIRAILLYVGHIYENPMGQGPVSKYEVSQKLSGNIPPTVASLLEPYIYRSFR